MHPEECLRERIQGRDDGRDEQQEAHEKGHRLPGTSPFRDAAATPDADEPTEVKRSGERDEQQGERVQIPTRPKVRGGRECHAIRHYAWCCEVSGAGISCSEQARTLGRAKSCSAF